MKRVIILLIIAGLCILIFSECKKDEIPVIIKATVKDIDGNTYDTIIIGKQVWFAQNLKVTRLNNGSPIDEADDAGAWSKMQSPAFSFYRNQKDSFKAEYGTIYNWFTIETELLCPAGWRVPNDTDWNNLIAELGGLNVAGGVLKEKGFAHWQSPNLGATDSVNFHALPGGYRNPDGSFDQLGKETGWWSSTEMTAFSAYGVFLEYNKTEIQGGYGSKKTGLYIRCIKDL